MLDLDQLHRELRASCADAGLEPGSIAVYVVDAARPGGTTPMAYLHPAGFVWPDTVAVFRAVGAERVRGRHLRAHRLAVWRELPGIPDAALGPMLRHELEHARRWERSGTRFFEADDMLRASVRGDGGGAYASLPSEVEANAASSAYALRTLATHALEALRDCADCRALVDPSEAPADVVEATLAALTGRDDWAPWLDEPGRRAYLADVRRACAEWDEQRARELTSRFGEPEIEIVPDLS